MNRGKPLQRHTPLRAETPLSPMSDRRRAELADAGVAAPFTTLASTMSTLAGPRGTGIQRGRRHVHTIPAILQRALNEAAARSWAPSGDLLPADFRANSLTFKLLPDVERILLTCVLVEGGCWEWLGSLRRNGYGQFTMGGRPGYAHRAAYELFVGRIPVGKTVDHVCHNESQTCNGGIECSHRRCINPDHFQIVDGVENYRRGVAARKLCSKGHPLDSGNRLARARCRICFADNVQVQSDRVRLALIEQGAARAQARVSDADVQEMQRMRAAGRRVVDIAPMFGITAKYASALISGSRSRRRNHTGPTPAVRRIVASRSGGRCEAVGCANEAVHQHHRRPRRMGGSMAVDSNLPPNLLHLCVRHHEWVENNRSEALSKGLLVRANEDPATVPVVTRHDPEPVLLCVDGSWRTASPGGDPSSGADHPTSEES